MISVLVNDLGADVDAILFDGSTPLDVAKMRGRQEAACVLEKEVGVDLKVSSKRSVQM